jgi:2-C-methyl-D-erythritol 4-phosphate cytidylyltransferase
LSSADSGSARPLPAGFTSILLAGNRPGIDPLAAHFGVAAKALVRLDGAPLVSRVAQTLLAHPRIGRLLILSQADHGFDEDRDTRWLLSDPRVVFLHGGDSVSAALIDALETFPTDYPFLVTTADHGLLNAAILDSFIGPAERADADLVVGMVERRVLEGSYAGNRRTWLRFRGGSYSGANLFWIASPQALAALQLWRGIEQQRKRGRAVIGAFGPLMLLGVALRLLTLSGALRRAGKRLGLRAAAVELPIAEACIDIDKPDDHALATRILAVRR